MLAQQGCCALRFPDDWKGLKNGALLVRLKQMGAACLITCDKNLSHQQSIVKSGIAVVVLPRQRYGDLEPLAASIAKAVAEAAPGDTVIVAVDGTVSKE